MTKRKVKDPVKRTVKKQAVTKAIGEARSDPAAPSATVLVRNIHNTGIWTGTCKLAPGHAVAVDRGIVEKLLEAGFVEVME